MRVHSRALLLAWIGSGIASTAGAQTQSCTLPPTDGQNLGWTQDQQITVYVDPDTSAAHSSQINTAFTNWTRAGGSGVTFEIQAHYAYSRNPPNGAIGVRKSALGSTADGDLGGRATVAVDLGLPRKSGHVG